MELINLELNWKIWCRIGIEQMELSGIGIDKMELTPCLAEHEYSPPPIWISLQDEG